MTLRIKIFALTVTTCATAMGLGAALTSAQEKPFGDPKNVAFAKSLWSQMKKYRLVGPNRINVRPFEGNEPHGSIQQVLSRQLTVKGRTAKVIVKVNHGGEDIIGHVNKLEIIEDQNQRWLAFSTQEFTPDIRWNINLVLRLAQ